MVRDPGGRRRRYAVVAGGGTAGHVLPALSVAKALEDRGHDAARIELVGSRRGQEQVLLADCTYRVRLFPGRGIRRAMGWEAVRANAGAGAGLAWATAQSVVSMVRDRPHVVVSVGGYASVPSGVAAVLCRVPLVLVNVDAVPGLAHRLLGRVARASAVAFDGTALRNAVVTGSPVRPEIGALARDPESQRRARAMLGIPVGATVVVAVGGSLGARRVNEAVRGLASAWSGADRVALYHVVGRRDWPEFGALLPDDPARRSGAPGAGSGLWYRTVPFADDMASLYAAADLVIGRAGAMTVAELAVTGVPAVLVPLPGAPGDHQGANARALEAAGGAVVLPDPQCTPERLAEVVGGLLADPEVLVAMGESSRSVGRPDAADRVAAVVDAHAA